MNLVNKYKLFFYFCVLLAVCHLESSKAYAAALGKILVSAENPITIKVQPPGWYFLPPDMQRIPIKPDKEAIYGIEFEIKGTSGIECRPVYVFFYGKDGIKRDDPGEMPYRDDCNIVGRTLNEKWQTVRLEAMVKKGTYYIGWNIILSGIGEVKIRNVRLVEGGFPDNPSYVGPPYLDWIEALRPLPTAKLKPMLKVNRTVSRWPEILWNFGTTIIGIDPAEVNQLKTKTKSYMLLPLSRLLDIVPERMPPGGFQMEPGLLDKLNQWDPLEPNILRNYQGKILNINAGYPISGYEEIISPRGRMLRYPYYEKFGESKIYLDFSISSVQCTRILEAAYNMAGIYAATGEKEYAIRAAAILYNFALRYRDCPIYGEGWMEGQKKFRPYDWYQWMSFTWGTWYTASCLPIIYLARTYSLLAEADVWNDLDKITGVHTRDIVIEDLFINTMKLTLRYDRFNSTNVWSYFHNTIGRQVTAFITVGWAINCPELVHYGVRKIDEALKWGFGVDGFFPQSVSYHHDMSGILIGLDVANDYSDPPGYFSTLDGRHFENLDPVRDYPMYGRVKSAGKKLLYPDGTYAVIHDTWPGISQGKTSDALVKVKPDILPAFGHVFLGCGENENSIQTHLHYSADAYTHNHRDPLNLILWAYGEELVSDIGYSNHTGYPISGDAHNTVILDGRNPLRTKQVGWLLQWHPELDGVQVAQASMPFSVDAKIYRRAIVAVPFKPGRNLVLDLFEVKGGKMQEWLANGSANIHQRIESSLKYEKILTNLANDGNLLTVAQQSEYPYSNGKKIDRWYGVFQNARIANNNRTWNVTMLPVENHGPTLKLHWLAPLSGEVIICEAPSIRLAEKSPAKLDEIRMPKVIVRLNGKAELDNTFVAVWEPFHKQAELKKAMLLSDVSLDQGIAVSLQYQDADALIIYRKPEFKGFLTANGLQTDASFAIQRTMGDRVLLSMYDGTNISNQRIRVETAPAKLMPLLTSGEEHGEYYLTVKGDMVGYPSKLEDQPHAGQHIMISQKNKENRWVPLKHVIMNGPKTKLVLEREPGFVYDATNKILHENYTPRRSIKGTAFVNLPSSIQVELSAVDSRKLKIKSSGDTNIFLNDIPENILVRAKSIDGGTWWTPYQINVSGRLTIKLPLERCGKGWTELELSRN